MKLRPIRDRVVVKREKPKTVTDGGIILPERAEKQTNIGTVISIGPGGFSKNGERQPMEVVIGDKILFCDFHTTQDQRLGDDIIVLDSEDILAVLEEL